MEERTVDLSLYTLVRECLLDPNLMKDVFYMFSLSNRENVHEIFKYKKFNDDFTDRVTCYRKDGELIGTVRPCYDEFLEKLVRILNIPTRGKVTDSVELDKKMRERLEILKNISSESELLMEFPLLYKDLNDGRRYYNDVQKLRRQENYDEEAFASGEHYYYGCALKKSLPNFIKSQSLQYERYINDRNKLKELQESKSYNGIIRKYFNIDKFYMYTIHEYLRRCEGTKDKEEIKKYLKLVEDYLNGSRDKSVSFKTDEGIKIDYDNIMKRYNNLKRIVSDNSSFVDWILVPEGRDYSRVEKKEEAQVTLMSLEEINRLRGLGEVKRNFYETSPYLAKAIGLRRYHGYIAYIYENGKVILDREYIPEHPATALGDAIYVMKAIDFENLSKLDKQVLMKHPKVGRMIHSKKWKERVQLVIDYEGSEEEKQDAVQLVKRLQEKK